MDQDVEKSAPGWGTAGDFGG